MSFILKDFSVRSFSSCFNVTTNYKPAAADSHVLNVFTQTHTSHHQHCKKIQVRGVKVSDFWVLSPTQTLQFWKTFANYWSLVWIIYFSSSDKLKSLSFCFIKFHFYSAGSFSCFINETNWCIQVKLTGLCFYSHQFFIDYSNILLLKEHFHCRTFIVTQFFLQCSISTFTAVNDLRTYWRAQWISNDHWHEFMQPTDFY